MTKEQVEVIFRRLVAAAQAAYAETASEFEQQLREAAEELALIEDAEIDPVMDQPELWPKHD